MDIWFTYDSLKDVSLHSQMSKMLKNFHTYVKRVNTHKKENCANEITQNVCALQSHRFCIRVRDVKKKKKMRTCDCTLHLLLLLLLQPQRHTPNDRAERRVTERLMNNSTNIITTKLRCSAAGFVGWLAPRAIQPQPQLHKHGSVEIPNSTQCVDTDAADRIYYIYHVFVCVCVLYQACMC